MKDTNNVIRQNGLGTDLMEIISNSKQVIDDCFKDLGRSFRATKTICTRLVKSGEVVGEKVIRKLTYNYLIQTIFLLLY